jgi:hypothetical protein
MEFYEALEHGCGILLWKKTKEQGVCQKKRKNNSSLAAGVLGGLRLRVWESAKEKTKEQLLLTSSWSSMRP